MNRNHATAWSVASFVLALLFAGADARSAPVGTSFTYQGELRFSGQPAAGPFDFEFALFDVEAGGSALGTSSAADRQVTQGLFSVDLDFTDVPFVASQAYWLEVRVREGADTGAYQTLLPRQRITASPYAINARSVQSGGVDNAAIADAAVTSAKIADGTVAAADLDTTQVQRRVSGTCAPGAAIRGVDATGAVTCQASGVGTVTNIATADGLTGGPIVGSGTISIAAGGVDSAKIADGTITGSDIQDASVAGVDLASNSVSSTRIVDGTIVAADVNSASVQVRVTGTCEAGIVGVNADGTASCDQAAFRVRPVTTFATELHASANGASSVVIGTDGFPLVAIHNTVSNDLVVVHCEDATCAAKTATAIDTAGDVGAYNSIGLDRFGVGVISYYDATNGDLKIALCNDRPCTSATIRTLDSTGDVGQYTSIGFTGFNRPTVAYHDETNGNLKMAFCNDDNKCTNFSTVTTDASGNDVGHNASLLLFRNIATIAYQDATARTLKVAVCGIGVCNSASLLTLDGTTASGDALSMTRTASGFPAVFYTRNGDIYVVRCTNLNCTTFTAGTLLSADNATFLSASIDAMGFPVVAFVLVQAPSDSFGFLRCADVQCTSAYRTIDSSTANPGHNAAPTIALGHHGFPLFTQRSGSRTMIHVCDNAACATGSRGR